MRVVSFAISFSHAAKSVVPGNGVSMTNCANVTPARFATATVASNVLWRSLGRPKMNEPSTCTPWCLKARSRSTSPSPASLNPLWTSFRPSGVTDSTPTSAPLIRALLHRIEKLGILGRFHGDLREEHHVVRQLGQPPHQFEPLGANGAAASEIAIDRVRREAICRSVSVTG